ncbi:MAG: DUF177 domain-containing protein [Gammaproteobacteria bacterium]|nr:DUF177 domain-containing protein [Gammaproteobacteria bacterium]
MSPQQLPVQIDPLQFGESRRQLDGTLPISAMSRLLEEMVDPDKEGKISISLQFATDSEGYHTVQGRAETAVSLQCQRCMEPVVLKLTAEILLAVVKNEHEVDQLPPHYEPLLLSEGQVQLAELIEDELLLSLPMIPRHEEDCLSFQLTEGPGDLATNEENPFAVLESLKRG